MRKKKTIECPEKTIGHHCHERGLTMYGMPGGSNGGLPMGPIAFWFLIILTVIVVIGFVALVIYVVNEIEMEFADSTAHLAGNPPGAKYFPPANDLFQICANRCPLPP
jgi:hypothetical protein